MLGEIVHHDQVGYIKDRNIGEAVRLIDDMFFCSLNQDNGYLVAADFEKAFDSVDHDFLFKVLELFGFGISICSWVKTLYTDISSCVMNGGRSTGYFNIERGVRRGTLCHHTVNEGELGPRGKLGPHNIRLDKIVFFSLLQ